MTGPLNVTGLTLTIRHEPEAPPSMRAAHVATALLEAVREQAAQRHVVMTVAEVHRLAHHLGGIAHDMAEVEARPRNGAGAGDRPDDFAARIGADADAAVAASPVAGRHLRVVEMPAEPEGGCEVIALDDFRKCLPGSLHPGVAAAGQPADAGAPGKPGDGGHHPDGDDAA